MTAITRFQYYYAHDTGNESCEGERASPPDEPRTKATEFQHKRDGCVAALESDVWRKLMRGKSPIEQLASAHQRSERKAPEDQSQASWPCLQCAHRPLNIAPHLPPPGRQMERKPDIQILPGRRIKVNSPIFPVKQQMQFQKR